MNQKVDKVVDTLIEGFMNEMAEMAKITGKGEGFQEGDIVIAYISTPATKNLKPAPAHICKVIHTSPTSMTLEFVDTVKKGGKPAYGIPTW